MRKRLAALAVASFLVVPAAAEAAPASDTPVGASASQASVKTLKSALRKDVKRALKSVRKLDLATVASKGFTLKGIRALTAGKLSLAATVRSDSGRVTVTKGSRTFGKSGKKNVRVKLTRSGKQLLGATNRATLRLKATFAARTGGRVTVVYRVTLKRSPGSSIGPEGGTLPPATPVAPIPADATPLYSQNFENSDPSRGVRVSAGSVAAAARWMGQRRRRRVCPPGAARGCAPDGRARALRAQPRWLRRRPRAGQLLVPRAHQAR